MSNADDTELSKVNTGGDNLEDDSSTSFLSKIALRNNLEEEDDKEIDSILNKEDDDYIPKTELDNNIEKLIEKLQSLDVQEALIAEKAKNKAEQHGEERKIRYERKTFKKNGKILPMVEKYKSSKVSLLLQKRNLR